MKSKGRWSREIVLLLPTGLEVCPGWSTAPLCCAESMDFTSTILLPGTHWNKEKATSNFLWTSSETQTSSDPDPSRGRKRVWAHNNVPSCANSCLSRRTFKAELCRRDKKENENYSCFGKLVRCPEPQLLLSKAHSPSALATSLFPRWQMLLLPLAWTHHSSHKMLQLFREAEHKRGEPQKKPV